MNNVFQQWQVTFLVGWFIIITDVFMYKNAPSTGVTATSPKSMLLIIVDRTLHVVMEGDHLCSFGVASNKVEYLSKVSSCPMEIFRLCILWIYQW